MKQAIDFRDYAFEPFSPSFRQMATFALTAGLAIQTEVIGLNAYYDSIKPPPVVRYIPAECAPVSADALHVASDLLRIPDNMRPFSQSDNIFDITKANAQKYGITIKQADQSGLDYLISQQERGQTVQQVFSFARGYMQQFNIQLVDDAKITTSGVVSKNVSEAFATSALNMEFTFDNLPAQYIALSGIHTIYISAKGVNSAAAYADTSKTTDGAIHANFAIGYTGSSYVQSGIDSATWNHELSHLVDAVLCGGPAKAENDPVFKAMNPLDVDYTKKTASYTGTYEAAVQSGNSQIVTEYPENSDSNLEVKQAETTLQKSLDALAPSITTYSDYHTNVLEDKAETLKNISNPYESDVMIGDRFPTLHKKFVLLFARLYQKSPQLARYFSANAQYMAQISSKYTGYPR